jgi:mediator of RNA polymerase II transcription subunit 12, fungi type
MDRALAALVSNGSIPAGLAETLSESHFIDPSSGHGSVKSAAEEFRNDQISWPKVPFPPRPGQSHHASAGPLAQIGPVTSTTNGIKPQADPPAIARVYANGREYYLLLVNLLTMIETADYCPWRGNHAEDNLSEQTVKTGFQNKPLITNESNTARPSVYHHLRNKGTQSLSALFVSLLEKRQAANRVAAPSTFKLPPRLTMSISRREAFLKELADPSRPLRKLNRSVPHGISGRVLLDQCLSRKIAVPRATWLAKCIGAHDIRAIKRKSAAATGTTAASSSASTMSSEAKWIKEWTVQVQNFIKSAFSGAGQPDWKVNLDYVIRFSTNLFYEKLLDEEHFLDWLLLSFETSSVEQMPIWMLFLQIYWKDLTSTRKRGKRMAEALLLHIEQASVNNFDGILNPVVNKAERYVVRLAIFHPGCLITPKSWSRYRPLLQGLVDKARKPEIKLILSNLIRRNDRLTGLTSDSEEDVPSVVAILDSWTFDSDESAVLEKCIKAEEDPKNVVYLILQWASSVYRHGKHRIYIAARLLRKLREMNHDIDPPIWNAITNLSQSFTNDEHALHQVTVELVRTRHFRIGRFLQYLISTGLSSTEIESQDSALIRLLRSLPLKGESEQVRNLHDILLESANVNLSVEDEQFAAFKLAVASNMDNLDENDLLKLKSLLSETKESGSLNARQIFSFGFWLRKQILSRLASVSEIRHTSWVASPEAKCYERLFFVARTLLETLGEFPCLADVMMAFMELDSQPILASVAQTIHHGLKVYISFTAVKPLFDKLVARYELVRSRQPLDKSFCSALHSLSISLDANQSLIAQTGGDLLRCDQMATAAMCSPASDSAAMTTMDSMPAVFGSDETAVSDVDIEKSLSSGTNMDEFLQERLLKHIVARMSSIWSSGLQLKAALPAGQWLARLRAFNPQVFDTRFKSVIISALSRVNNKGFLYEFLLPTAVGAECFSIADFVRCFEDSLGTDADAFETRRMFVESLLPGDSLDEHIGETVSHSQLEGCSNSLGIVQVSP